MPARFFVQRRINRALDERVVRPQLLYDLDVGQMMLAHVPRNLLGALWLQFAQAISGDLEYRTCKECGKTIEVATDLDGRSARKLFCSDPCKSRDYRRRKDLAKKMKAEGKSVKDIAEELVTDISTIQKWVGKRKGGKRHGS
jgi:hypothetical protein